MTNIVWSPWIKVMQMLTHKQGSAAIKRPPCALCKWWNCSDIEYMAKRPLLCNCMETWPDFSCFVLAEGRTEEELRTEVTRD